MKKINFVSILCIAILITGLLFCSISKIIKNNTKQNNVVLFIVDALRNDCFDNADMKFCSSKIEDGMGCVCIAGGNRTFDGFNTILTGKYVCELEYTDSLALNDSEVLISEALKGNGYETMFISACVGDAGFEIWNYQQGFDIFCNYSNEPNIPPPPNEWYKTGNDYKETVNFFMNNFRNSQLNKFIVLHIAEPHAPYSDIGSTMEEKYYNACCEADISIQHLCELLGEYGITEDNTTFMLTSDHGEQLEEYGYAGHGDMMIDEEIKVPMILWGKHVPAMGTVDRVASHLDLFTTICVLTNTPLSEELLYEGRYLLDDLSHTGMYKRKVMSMNYCSGLYDVKVYYECW